MNKISMTAIISGRKVCPACQVDKSLTEYHIDRSHSTGHQARCKVCQRAAVRAAQGTWYYAANADGWRVRQAVKRAAEYGVENTLTLADWAGILEKQKGKCALCGEAEVTYIDHVQPMSIGGGNVASNVQGLCRPCERHKTRFDLRLIAAVRRQARKVVAA